MTKKDINRVVWWIPFKKTRNSARMVLLSLMNMQNINKDIQNLDKNMQNANKDIKNLDKNIQNANKDIKNLDKNIQNANKDIQNSNKNIQNANRNIQQIEKALADPLGVGQTTILLRNAHVATKYYNIFYKMKENDICIDCGANVGVFTDICIHQGATVHAFEPNSDVLPILEKKYKDNKLVVLMNKAVGGENKKLQIYKHKDEDNLNFLTTSQCASFIQNNNHEPVATDEIDVIDLVEYINKLLINNESIYILKIDIEGAEYEVLDKLISSEIYKKIKYVMCETHGRFSPELLEKEEKIKSTIEEKGIKNIYLDWI